MTTQLFVRARGSWPAALWWLAALFTRRAWPALLALGCGVLAGIIIACATPILTYSGVTLAARHTFGQPYQNTVVVTDDSLTSGQITTLTTRLDEAARATLAPYAVPAATLAARSPDLTLEASGAPIHLLGVPAGYFNTHFTTIQGRFPQAGDQPDLVALTQATAQALALRVGDPIAIALTNGASPLLLRVSAIVQPEAVDPFDPFSGEPVDPITTGGHLDVTALLPTAAVLRLMSGLPASLGSRLNATWMFALPPGAIDARNMVALERQLFAFTRLVGRQFVGYPGAWEVFGTALPALRAANASVATTRLPIMIIMAQLLLLVGWFLVTACESMVARLAEPLAVLRSRGAQSGQTLAAALLPIALVCVVSGVVGPWLAVAGASFIAARALPGAAASGVTWGLLDNPGALIADLGWYVVGTMLVCLGVCAVALWRQSRVTIRALRQTAARSAETPVWQRHSVDLFVILVSLLGYGLYALYLSADANPDTLRTFAPFAVGMPMALMVGGAMLFARIMPWLIARARTSALARRGIIPYLPLTQLLQSRRAVSQVTLFFAIAVMIGSFTLIYQATDQRHSSDAAAFQVGADL